MTEKTKVGRPRLFGGNPVQRISLVVASEVVKRLDKAARAKVFGGSRSAVLDVALRQFLGMSQPGEEAAAVSQRLKKAPVLDFDWPDYCKYLRQRIEALESHCGLKAGVSSPGLLFPDDPPEDDPSGDIPLGIPLGEGLPDPLEELGL